MAEPPAGEITRLLGDWRQGDEQALARLMSMVYGPLKAIAASHLRRERADHTLRTSALVHEAFLRLVDQRQVAWQNRAHFLAIAARMMRRVLLNHARDQGALKRGGKSHPRISLDAAASVAAAGSVEVLELEDALGRLAAIHPGQAQVVELRFYAGMSSSEIAEVLDISVPTVTRRWRVARAWLFRSLKKEE